MVQAERKFARHEDIYEGLELHLHALLTYAIDRCKWSIPRSRHFISWEKAPRTRSIEGWVGLQSRFGSWAGNKNISIMKPTWCTFHLIYRESKASTCFEHYLRILRRRCATANWLYAHNIPNVVCSAPPVDEQVMLETCRGLWFSIH
jgi:hypothetical protein